MFCIGGPLNGRWIEAYDDLTGYTQYNAACGGGVKNAAQAARKAITRRTPRPKAVLIHVSLLNLLGRKNEEVC